MRRRAAVGAVVSMLVLAACEGDAAEDAADDPEVPVDDRVITVLDAAAAGAAPVESGAQRGGELTVLASSDPAIFDAASALDGPGAAILGDLVARSLTGYQFRDGEMVLVPDLATDLGRPDADMLVWEFTLRQGVKFADGTPVEAEDVAVAVERGLSSDVVPAGLGPDVEQVEALDPDTVRVTLAEPFAELPFVLAAPLFSPTLNADLAADPVEQLAAAATGPYEVEEYEPDESLVLVRNEHWDPITDPTRGAYPDRWVLDFEADLAADQPALLADEPDLQTSLTYEQILPEVATSLAGQPSGDRVATGPDSCTTLLHIDTEDIADIEVRRAIAAAFPAEETLVASGLVSDLTAASATTILPPNLPGWVEPEEATEGAAGTDLAGVELRFAVGEDGVLPAVADVWTTAFVAAGFTVAETPADTANLRLDEQCAQWPSGFTMMRTWSADAQESAAGGPFQPLDRVENRLDGILGLPLAEGLLEWGELAATMLAEDQPAVATHHGLSSLLHGSRVGGMQVDSTNGFPVFANLYVVP